MKAIRWHCSDCCCVYPPLDGSLQHSRSSQSSQKRQYINTTFVSDASQCSSMWPSPCPPSSLYRIMKNDGFFTSITENKRNINPFIAPRVFGSLSACWWRQNTTNHSWAKEWNTQTHNAFAYILFELNIIWCCCCSSEWSVRRQIFGISMFEIGRFVWFSSWFNILPQCDNHFSTIKSKKKKLF